MSLTTQAEIAVLSDLATRAITSHIKSERDSAAGQLRYLSSFDAWESVKQMLPEVQNNYLRFILCKAILFTVSNEIGPEERAEMQEYMLKYLHSFHSCGTELPRFVRMEVYTILACAFHSNWKYSLLSSSPEELETHAKGGVDASAEAVRSLLCRLEECLPPHYLLECLTEMVSFFTRQALKQTIYSVARQSTRSLYPQVLQVTVKALTMHPARALELSSLILSSIPEKEIEFGSASTSASNSIFIEEWHLWRDSMQSLLSYCLQVVTAGQAVDEDVMQQASQFLQLCANVDSNSEEFIQMSYTFFEHFLSVADAFIQESANLRAQGCESREDRLLLALSLLISVVERDRDHMARYLDSQLDRLTIWGMEFVSVLQRFDPEQEELHKSILRLYAVLCRYLLPDYPTPGESNPVRRDIYLNSPGRGKRDNERRALVYTPSPALCDLIKAEIAAVFRTQLVNVVNYAHLKEDSMEMRSDTGIFLHNERILQPLAELLFSERANLLPIVEEKLNEILSYYNRFIRMRERIVSLSQTQVESFMWSLEEQEALQVFENEQQNSGLLFPSVPQAASAAAANGPTAAVYYQLTGNTLMCLSRLSVVISIFAIAITTGRVSNLESVLQYVSDFASPLLCSDDSLTETLLENFMLDNDNVSSVEHRQQMANNWRSGAQKLHFGIIRSLFFFCNCLIGSSANEQRHELFNEITLSLLRFVYLHHSDEPALVNDANWLLLRSMSYVVSARKFLGSDKMITVLHALKDQRIALMNPQLTETLKQQQQHMRLTDEEVRQARVTFLTAITVFIETRFYSGFSVIDILESLVASQLSPESLATRPAQALENILAITSGCRQPDTFMLVTDAVLERSSDVAIAIRHSISDPAAATTVMKWCAKVCVLASQLMSENGTSYFTYELLTFVLNTATTYFEWLASDGMGGGGRRLEPGDDLSVAGLQNGNNNNNNNGGVSPSSGLSSSSGGMVRYFFRNGAVEVDVVYHLFKMVGVICGSEWCKMGVVVHYDRSTVLSFFSGLSQVVISTSAEMVMSSPNEREVLFRGMLEALENTGDTLDFIFSALLRHGVLEQLIKHFAQCLSYAFCPPLLALLFSLLKRHERHSTQLIDGSPTVSPTALQSVFREVIVLVVLSSHLELRDLHHSFNILSHCFRHAERECLQLLTDLLEYCTAYHRVRLRCIQSMLIQDRQDKVEAYVSIFGQSSKVGILAPW